MAYPESRPSDELPRRRSVVAGVGWAVPVLAATAAAPALAASTVSASPALVGSGTIVRNSCTATANSPGPVSVTFDSRPSYTTTAQPTAGIWVTNLPSSVSIVSATHTIYIDSRFTAVSWSYAGSSSSQRQWSLPVLDSNAPSYAGLVAYTSTYQPNLATPWTAVNGASPPYVIATYGAYFTLSATTPANSCGGLFTFRNARTVVLSNGTALTNVKAPAST